METVDVQALLEHRDFLKGLARSLLRDEARADDAVQDAYIAALRRPPRDPALLKPWLARVVRNFALRDLRGEKRRAARHQAVPPAPPVPSPDEILARENLRRSVVVLRWLEDLPPRAIAKRLGVPVETVRTRLKRGLARLKGRLDEKHGGRRAWALALVPLAVPTGSALAGVLGRREVGAFRVGHAAERHALRVE